MNLRIGTRGSDLALWQARFVAGRLEQAGHAIEIVVLQTRGDRIDDVPLHQIEGKAFFTAEIERALLDGEVDLAVHSHKDLPVEEPPGLSVVAIPGRAAAGERLLIAPHAHDPAAPLLPLRIGASVGTSSPRREAQLRALRADLAVQPLRGNVPTRVRRVHEGRHDAVLLASAGLDRLALDLAGLVAFDVPTEILVPAPAQGALAVQTRSDDAATRAICRELLHDPTTAAVIAAERQLLLDASGGCNLPLGCVVEAKGDGWRCVGFLGADHPKGAPARWARAMAADPATAVARVRTDLLTGEHTAVGPLRGVRVALAGSADRSRLGDRLATLGARVTHERVVTFADRDHDEFARALASARVGDVVAVTSREAARRLSRYELPDGVVVVAVGESTASVLRAAGVAVEFVGSGGAAELARAMPVGAGQRVLFPCSTQATDALETELGARGIAVERHEIYRTVPRATPDRTACDARVFMSPSSVEACAALERGSEAVRVAVGATTAAACAALGLAARAPAGRDPEQVIDVLLQLCQPEPEVRA